LLAQVALALGSLGIPLALGGRMPGNAATLAALCLLLLYPLNRGFLHFVSQKRPGLLNRAIFFCVLRPFLWCLGLASAAVDRLLSGGVK
jgi:hypothetical protein